MIAHRESRQCMTTGSPGCSRAVLLIEQANCRHEAAKVVIGQFAVLVPESRPDAAPVELRVDQLQDVARRGEDASRQRRLPGRIWPGQVDHGTAPPTRVTRRVDG